jgi:7-keto-8-aminopelargonate synthetase-like enzyme
MYTSIKEQLGAELEDIRTAGLFKTERSINSPQSSHINAGALGQPGADVLNFCANNYLGLADHPDIINAAKAAMDERGFGMASVRFIWSPASWEQRTPSSSPAALMPTAASSSPFSDRRTPSSPTP